MWPSLAEVTRPPGTRCMTAGSGASQGRRWRGLDTRDPGVFYWWDSRRDECLPCSVYLKRTLTMCSYIRDTECVTQRECANNATLSKTNFKHPWINRIKMRFPDISRSHSFLDTFLLSLHYIITIKCCTFEPSVWAWTVVFRWIKWLILMNKKQNNFYQFLAEDIL